MDSLEFEEKLKIKKFLEKKIYLTKKDREKINLLKGTLDFEKKNIVEKLLNDKKYYYTSGGFEDEARSYYIGKAIVILTKERNIMKEFISLKDFDSGIAKYMELVGGEHQGYMEYSIEVKGKIDMLVEDFNDLGKWHRIEKGRILKEIDAILSENKELGTKAEMWEKLGISSSDKSMLCKRHSLFLEFQNNELFNEDNSYMKVIEDMTDAKLKEITKEGLTLQEKEEILLSLIK